jgi:hypothetical protein
LPNAREGAIHAPKESLDVEHDSKSKEKDKRAWQLQKGESVMDWENAADSKRAIENGRRTRVCVCGNTQSDDGFYPCDLEGNEVDSGDADNELFCNQCRRIIDRAGIVIGVRIPGARDLE